jgi:hypothetical protein
MFWTSQKNCNAFIFRVKQSTQPKNCLNPGNESTMILQNIRNHKPNDTASYPRRLPLLCHVRQKSAMYVMQTALFHAFPYLSPPPTLPYASSSTCCQYPTWQVVFSILFWSGSIPEFGRLGYQGSCWCCVQLLGYQGPCWCCVQLLHFSCLQNISKYLVLYILWYMWSHSFWSCMICWVGQVIICLNTCVCVCVFRKETISLLFSIFLIIL